MVINNSIIVWEILVNITTNFTQFTPKFLLSYSLNCLLFLDHCNTARHANYTKLRRKLSFSMLVLRLFVLFLVNCTINPQTWLHINQHPYFSIQFKTNFVFHKYFMSNLDKIQKLQEQQELPSIFSPKSELINSWITAELFAVQVYIVFICAACFCILLYTQAGSFSMFSVRFCKFFKSPHNKQRAF